MSTTNYKRKTKSAKKMKVKEKQTKAKTTTMRMEEEKVEDIPAGNYEMEVDNNGSSSSEDSSGLGDISLNTVFVMIKVQLSTRTKLLEELRQKYVTFFTIIMEVDESIMVETADSGRKDEPIKTIDGFPAKMTGISNYFYSSGRPPKINPKSDKSPMVWVTSRPSFDGKWEDLVNCTSYDLEEDGVQPLRKHAQCFKTEINGYLLFVHN